MSWISREHNTKELMDKKLLEKVLSGLSDTNIQFDDLKKLIQGFSFDCRIKGNHHIFTRKGIVEIINLQPLRGGKAKPYQVKQVRNLILKYKLHKEGRNV
jgi:hypothetical protein